MATSNPPDTGTFERMVDAAAHVMRGAQWTRAEGDDLERARLLAEGMCDALSECRLVYIPSALAMRNARWRRERNVRIAAEARTHKIADIAARYRISERQVRRILVQVRREVGNETPVV